MISEDPDQSGSIPEEGNKTTKITIILCGKCPKISTPKFLIELHIGANSADPE